MDELLGRRVPHSAQAEQAVIGSLLIDPGCISQVIDRVKPAEFYIQANREIYETVLTMFSYGQTIDPVTVLEQMKQRGGSAQHHKVKPEAAIQKAAVTELPAAAAFFFLCLP